MPLCSPLGESLRGGGQPPRCPSPPSAGAVTWPGTVLGAEGWESGLWACYWGGGASPLGSRWQGTGQGTSCLTPREQRSAQTCPTVLGWSSGGRSDSNPCWVSQLFWQQSVWGLLHAPGGEVAGQMPPAGPGPVGRGFNSWCRAGSGRSRVLLQPRLEGRGLSSVCSGWPTSYLSRIVPYP